MARTACVIAAGGLLVLFLVYALTSSSKDGTSLLHENQSNVVAQLKDLTVAVNQLRREIVMLKRDKQQVERNNSTAQFSGINAKYATLYQGVDKALVDYFPRRLCLATPNAFI